MSEASVEVDALDERVDFWWTFGKQREKKCKFSTLGKMKPLLADKLVVSMLGVERDEDAIALFSGNLDGGGRQIDDCENTPSSLELQRLQGK